MKILIPLTGVTGMLGVVLGALFKILHLPGADELLRIGLFTSLVIFLPLVLFQRYRKSTSRKS
jgi:amino acid transporter